MGFRTHFRDKQEWLDSTNGRIVLNTTSDEAARQYDATITQLCGWYEDETLGGIGGTSSRMVKADPEFLLGRALDLELALMGAMQTPRSNGLLAKELEELNKLADKKSKAGLASDQELLHVKVVNHWAASELKEASLQLERLSCLYPEDVSALKMNQDNYFMLGQALPMRNYLSSSLAQMSEKNPLKGYVHGMMSFALEESNQYQLAQTEALKALKLIPNDTWAIHNYAHCLEMQALTDEGLKWMEDRKCDWSPCQMLACHQYWHTALFHINKGQFDEAVVLLDSEVLARCRSSGTSLDLHDSASMIYRMELVDLFSKVNNDSRKQDRWKCVYDISLPHQNDHLLGFNDAHYMMAFLGTGNLKGAREMIESIDQVPALNGGQTVVKPLLEAMYQFKVGDYARCVDLLERIRFDIIKIGGSHAQRDIFEQLLLVASLKSDKPNHNKLGQRMLLEREAMHSKRLPQTELLAQQAKQ